MLFIMILALNYSNSLVSVTITSPHTPISASLLTFTTVSSMQAIIIIAITLFILLFIFFFMFYPLSLLYFIRKHPLLSIRQTSRQSVFDSCKLIGIITFMLYYNYCNKTKKDRLFPILSAQLVWF